MRENDQEFYAVVDRFIALANELVPEHGLARISATLLFAASRFNAHNFLVSDGDRTNVDTAVEYYCAQYRGMLIDNMKRLESLEDE